MPEVADAAGILFEPHSTGEMMRAIRDLVLDAELRARTERLGLKRAASFTWDTAARKTLDVYYGVADRRHETGTPKAKSVTVS
jgi:glycosyltransferase involved in cell wall biosynthesis